MKRESSLRVVTALCVAGALIACRAEPTPGPLDGRVYDVSLVGTDGGKGDPDQLVFAAGTFESTACRPHGFTRTSYATTEEGDVLRFVAEARNEDGASTHWEGATHGDAVEGTLDQTDPAGKVTRYRFGGQRAHRDLDGRSFQVTLSNASGKKEDDDQLVFVAGSFESTACRSYGFCPSSYSASVASGATRFESTTTSPSNGRIEWTGTVQGDRVEGQMTRTTTSGEVVRWTFTGTRSR